MFFLTVKHNEHFHHFPALLLSGSVGVLLFACYSGSTGILTYVPPHHGLYNKDKESRGAIIIGRQALLCLRFALKAVFDLTASVFVIWVRVVRQKCCYGRKGFHNNKKSL